MPATVLDFNPTPFSSRNLMKTLIRLLSTVMPLALLATFAPLSAQTENPLKSEMKAFRVETDPTGQEKLTATENVEPGQVVEYVVTYANISDQTLKQIKVDGPVPAEMTFVADSVRQPDGVSVEFSVDGGLTFSVPPVKYQKQLEDGKIVEAIATPDLYNRIRWTIGEMPAGTTTKLHYRTLVR